MFNECRIQFPIWLCSFARRNGESSFIAVESEETDYFEFRKPSLHPERSHER